MLDALEQAIHDRRPIHRGGLIHHSDRGSQYVSIKYTQRLAEAGIEPSVVSVGDSYDNALAETINGLLSGTGWNATGAGRSETAQADAAAQQKVWPEVIQFPQKYLNTGKTDDYSSRPRSTK